MSEVKNKLESVRVLHSAALLRPTSGMVTQMGWEQAAADELDLDWQVKMYCPANSKAVSTTLHYDLKVDANKLTNPLAKLLGWVKLRINYHRWLLRQQDEVDAFLLRYYVHDPFQLLFLFFCKKPVYFVHHTLEVPELALPGGLAGWVRATLERILGFFSIRKTAGIIGVTQEIVDYELNRANSLNKPNCVYPNGIVFSDYSLEDQRTQNVPELLFVANFSPWHGLDLLLNEIKNTDANFVLHLVGKIPSELEYLLNDTRINVHSVLTHQQITDLSQQCWVGLSSFALSRKNMKQACPLKVREYLMLGLPVYGDYEDVFPEDAPYFKKGSERLEEILEFAHATRELDKKAVSEMAREWVDKKILLGRLSQELMEMKIKSELGLND